MNKIEHVVVVVNCGQLFGVFNFERTVVRAGWNQRVYSGFTPLGIEHVSPLVKAQVKITYSVVVKLLQRVETFGQSLLPSKFAENPLNESKHKVWQWCDLDELSVHRKRVLIAFLFELDKIRHTGNPSKAYVSVGKFVHFCKSNFKRHNRMPLLNQSI